MSGPVCTGATLTCSFGTTGAPFRADVGARVSARAAVGVVADSDTTSVGPFGDCTSVGNPQVNAATQAANGVLTPQPCRPVLTGDWSPGAVRVRLGRAAALTGTSQCACGYGGVITVGDSGSSGVTFG